MINHLNFSNKKQLTLREASIWASYLLNKNISIHNISYLVQYGLIDKKNENGSIFIEREELESYYKKIARRETNWKKQLGKDLNWKLSFENLKERDTTKHVHRLHSYKGKFIPQLVEYFLNNEIDNFKTDTFFKKGDIVVDPFCGSGTTLVQASEMNMHAIGIDVSYFNSFIANSKITNINISDLKETLKRINNHLDIIFYKENLSQFENILNNRLLQFNIQYFPSPEFKIKVKQGEINEKFYAKEKLDLLLPEYFNIVNQYKICFKHKKNQSFLSKWYIPHVLEQAQHLISKIEQESSDTIKNILKLILSRTMRSCRATTHADLATLKDPQLTPYYCRKHGKICKPVFSLAGWWKRYCQDTIKRFNEFQELKTSSHQVCLTGDAKNIDLMKALQKEHYQLAQLVLKQKVKGVFSSPPYVGLIDYHEQHAYAYELFGFPRKDELEIGSLLKGQGEQARELYVNEISQVLLNTKKVLTKNYHVFLVANDKYNMYPHIAQKSNMKIVNQYKRPVLNRTEKNRNKAYCEIIFHLKEKN